MSLGPAAGIKSWGSVVPIVMYGIGLPRVNAHVSPPRDSLRLEPKDNYPCCCGGLGNLLYLPGSSCTTIPGIPVNDSIAICLG
jgi:hypothetical protein